MTLWIPSRLFSFSTVSVQLLSIIKILNTSPLINSRLCQKSMTPKNCLKLFPYQFKLIYQYQQKDPSLIDKYEMGTYQKGSFRGGSNIYLNFITCEDNIFIPLILQSFMLHWYHTYLLHPVMDRTEAMIRQHLYWLSIITAA